MPALLAPLRDVVHSVTLLLRLLKGAGVSLRPFATSVVLLTLSGFCTLLEMHFLLRFFTTLIHEGTSPRFIAIITVATVGFFAFALFATLLSYSATVLTLSLLRSATQKLRLQLFRSYLHAGKSFFDRNDFTALNTTLFRHTEKSVDALGALHTTVAKLMIIAASLVALSVLSLPLAVFVSFAYGTAFLIMITLLRRAKDLNRDEQRLRTQVEKKVFHVLTCMSLIQSYARQKNEEKEFEECSEEEILLNNRMAQRTQALKEVHHILSLIVLFATTVVLLLTSEPEWLRLHLASIITFLVITRLMANAVETVGNQTLIMLCTMPIIDHIAIVFKRATDRFKIHGGVRQCDGLRSDIQLRNVFFAYPDHAPVLRGVTCTIPAGKTTAIVGKTGCGKTTIAHLLLRFYEYQSGEILVDGKDLRSFTLQSLRTCMTLMSQDIFLFHDNILQNIAYGSEHKPLTAIIEAIKLTRLHDLIVSLPRGYDTVIGDRGQTLSGGEKQRASLARSLLREANIVILDEPSSALDGETETHIYDAIATSTRGKTLIVIAHRPATIRHADHIIMLSDGRVAEEGAFDALQTSGGAFSAYWQHAVKHESITRSPLPAPA